MERERKQMSLYPLRLKPVIILVVSTAIVSSSAAGAEAARDLGEITLLRDSWGVPHVFADTDEGAMYGLGYSAAEDRGFQMHYFLRMIQGRVSEVFGVMDKKGRGGIAPRSSLEHDRLMRTFGFASAADEVAAGLDPETRQLLEAYSAGVNDYFSRHSEKEHYLFEQSGLVREPWTPADCLLSWWHLAQFFAKNGLRDYPSVSPPSSRRARKSPTVVDDEAAVVRREDVSEEWISRVNQWVEKMGLDGNNQKSPDSPEPKFSHAWVVGGENTTSEAAVLISDPQTPVWNPNMLYEFHVKGETFNARGVGVPGSPVILIGFNEQVAWGMTALGADQADLFILKTDGAHPDQYAVDGEWLTMNRREEVIQVKDDQPIRITVRETVFGPVVSEFAWRNPDDQEVALCRVPMAEPDRDTVQGAMDMIRARSCEEFAAALPGWRFPTANCIFGDSEGNIGYWSLGALPVRSPLTGADGSHAQDGSTREGMWRGMIPYNILPHCMSPQRGYLVSANHRTIQSFYQVPLGNMTGSSGDTDRGLRIKERIHALLEEKDRCSPQEVLDIQYDTVNVWKREIARLGYKISKSHSDSLSSNTKRALQYLRAWYDNGAKSDMSVQGTELANQIKVIFRRGRFGLVNKYGGGVSGLALFAKKVRARNAIRPGADVPVAERKFVDQVLSQAWEQALAAYGPDPQRWHGRAKKRLCRQQLGYMESLDGFPALDPRYNVSVPLLRTIDGSTVLSQRAQAYTQFVPLSQPDDSLSILPIGNSDNPTSTQRFSTYGDWARAQLHPAPLSRNAVERISVSVETLKEQPPTDP